MKLIKVIEDGMAKVNAQRTKDSLGDRTEYVGASDLAQCPRKAVMEKINGEDPDLTDLIRYERGHLTENILSNALEIEGYTPKRQMELKGYTENGTPMIFHIDFSFNGQNRFAVLEGKSTSPIPDYPYEGWELQLYAQMGLARDVLGNKAKIDGAIFALNMAPKNGEVPYGAWNGYEPDQDLWDSLRADADVIYQAVRDWKQTGNLPENLPLKPGPLCGFCTCLADCPIYQGERIDELAPQVEALLDLQQKRKKLAKLEEEAKAKLKAILRHKQGWVDVAVKDDIVKLKVNQKPSRRTDFKALRAALESYGDSMDNYQNTSEYEELNIKAPEK